MAVGRVLGVDYGTKRIGLAVSDGLGITARPLRVVEAESFAGEIGSIVAELDIVRVVVGLPTSLAGVEGESAEGARALADAIAAEVDLPVELADERFTTTRAEELLGRSERDRRKRRERVDAVAAAVMLQSWLDARRGRERGNPRYAPD